MIPGAYNYTADRKIWSGIWTDKDLREVLAANRDKEICPWCDLPRYSRATMNCAHCDTTPQLY